MVGGLPGVVLSSSFLKGDTKARYLIVAAVPVPAGCAAAAVVAGILPIEKRTSPRLHVRGLSSILSSENFRQRLFHFHQPVMNRHV